MKELEQIFNQLIKTQERQDLQYEKKVAINFESKRAIINFKVLVEVLEIFYQEVIIKASNNEELNLAEITKTLEKKSNKLPPVKQKRIFKESKTPMSLQKSDNVLDGLVKITGQDKKQEIPIVNKDTDSSIIKYLTASAFIVILIIGYFISFNKKEIVGKNALKSPVTKITKNSKKGKTGSASKKNALRPSAPKKNRSQRSRFKVQASKLPTPKKRVPSSNQVKSKNTVDKNNPRNSDMEENYQELEQTESYGESLTPESEEEINQKNNEYADTFGETNDNYYDDQNEASYDEKRNMEKDDYTNDDYANDSYDKNESRPIESY
tara:strand:+ start:12310 stop:13278 length:969 start_codon:yes stop_codon:yes gene_type:complete